tara:strand:- start:39 stop:536 length:498 start_codon:yes stop_codon:yes gene_type:complete
MKRFSINNGASASNHSTSYEYLFTNSKNKEKWFTFRISSHYSDKISFKLYCEFYRYINDWKNNQLYKIYDPDNYIVSSSALLEDDKILYISDYSSITANFVIQSKLSSNSNLHFIYSIFKGINGKSFNKVVDVLDFKSDNVTDNDKAEIFYENSLFIKYDFIITN